MPTPASFQGTPCMYCHDTTKTYIQGEKFCVSCGKPEKGTVEESPTATRDANGSLLCQTCKDPYPYAEPDAAGKFHCYDCRLTVRLKKELNPEAAPPVPTTAYAVTNVGSVSISLPVTAASDAGFIYISI